MGQFNAYTASQVTLGSSAPVVEQKIPLWVYSSGVYSTTASVAYLQKGSTASASTVGSQVKLYTLSSNWSANQKFAFEASIYSSNSAQSIYACLYDVTSGSSQISTSQISTNSTTATLIRSGSFTLTPGHVYAIQCYTPSASYTAYLTKAYLVALFS